MDERVLRARLLAAGVELEGWRRLGRAPEPIWRLVTHGARALDLWQRLRSIVDETACWPVILGEASRSDSDQPWEIADDRPTGDILAEASRTPADPRLWHSDLGLDAPRDEWNDEIEPQASFVLPLDILTMKPHERVGIALVPTLRGYEAPAFLRFGNWNSCPSPEQHVAVMRSWHQRFGAEPVGIGDDIVEVRVARPPEDRAAALALAEEQFGYCEDVVYQGMGSLDALAASLLGAKSWYFWWD
jgi:hypothetical protein